MLNLQSVRNNPAVKSVGVSGRNVHIYLKDGTKKVESVSVFMESAPVNPVPAPSYQNFQFPTNQNIASQTVTTQGQGYSPPPVIPPMPQFQPIPPADVTQTPE